jgi:hypothetical protein
MKRTVSKVREFRRLEWRDGFTFLSKPRTGIRFYSILEHQRNIRQLH